jgi:predicted ATPase/serine phosphatase RsbU (regulator of sigma subunit)/tRNA A-37 threonylcarbamoyl transferase component Bud32
VNLGKFKIIETIHENEFNVVFRARDDNKNLVILKSIKAFNNIVLSSEPLQREYQILSKINASAAPKVYEFYESSEIIAIVMENISGPGLKDYISSSQKNGSGIDLQDFFSLAHEIIISLNEIHSQNIIHKDIKTGNIFITPEKKIKIIDFGLSSILPRETTEIKPAQKLEGTLQYISPEQTGRMNRVVDYRSDYYSLGIVLYEMLTGKTPFAEKLDPMEIVHSHIAIIPLSPSQIRKDIPAALSLVVMKLMEKNAEHRYQSAAGIIHDLETCRLAWAEKKDIPDFSPGSADISGKFQLSQKLYGRERDIDLLMQAFDHSSGSIARVVFISGYSGIGKTSLVAELNKPIAAKGGYFLSGKFDQFRQNIPFSAFTKSFNNLVKQLLQESDDKLSYWKHAILKELTPNARLITELVPDLELIIGAQPPVASLGHIESRNRFNITIQKFIQIFSSPKHPLVLFIDDWQWADTASVYLLKSILTNLEMKSLLVICSYRDNEILSNHSFSEALSEIQNRLPGSLNVKVSPLDMEHTAQWISESFHLAKDDSLRLASMVEKKTGGNPFFIAEFLRNIYNAGFLSFNFKSGKWQFDEDKINQLWITDNVAELMTKRLTVLDENCQTTLKLSACLGSRFDWQMLSAVSSLDKAILAEGLMTAMTEGILSSHGSDYKFLETPAGISDPENNSTFDFLHDKIHQAAYMLLSDTEKSRIHLNIARLLSKKSYQMESRLIDIVSHYNSARHLISDPAEKLELCKMNLEAARKSIETVAYETAAKLLEISRELLPENYWKSSYGLSVEVFTESITVTSASKNTSETANHLYRDMQANTLHPGDLTNATIAMVMGYINQGEYQMAIHKFGMPLLKQLGFNLSANPGLLTIVGKLLRVRSKHHKLAQNHREISDERIKKIKSILREIGSASYLTEPNLFLSLVLTNFNLSMDYGEDEMILPELVGYSILLIAVLKKYDEAAVLWHQYDHYFHEKNPSGGKAAFGIAAFVLHFKENYHHILTLLNQAQKYTYGNGDFVYYGYSVTTLSLINTLINPSDKKLPAVKERILQSRDLLVSGSIQNNLIWVDSMALYPDALIQGPDSIQEKISQLETSINPHVFLDKLFLGLSVAMSQIYFNDHAGAKETFIKYDLTKGSNEILTHIINPLFQFYLSLTFLKTMERKTRLPEFIKKTLKKFKVWAKLCPDNRKHQYEILQALVYEHQGKSEIALEYFNKAMGTAEEYGFQHERALANELASQLLFKKGQNKSAISYAFFAKMIYFSWGAKAKVAQMNKTVEGLHRFTTIASEFSNKELSTISIDSRGNSLGYHTISTFDTHTSASSGSINLDYFTLLKASHALSKEIKLENLKNTLLEIMIQNSGSTKGALILPYDDGYYIDAEIGVNQKDTIPQNDSWLSVHVPLSNCNYLCIPVIQLALNLGQPVVIPDAPADPAYYSDPYIQKEKPRSILCSPILIQGKTLGAVYLENRIISDAYTPPQMEILNIISSQAAISIENARYYQTLEDKVTERTKTIEEQKIQLERKNMKMTADLNLARKIQLSLLPNILPELKGKIYFQYLPCEDVGGDFIDYCYSENNTLGLFICDVSGHGVSAALYAAMVKMSLLTWKETLESPANTIKAIQKSLKGKILENFLTACVVYIDFERRILRTSNAGHDPVIILKKGGSIVLKKPRGRIIVDYFPSTDYEQIEYLLDPGDKVIIYTDGLTEQRGQNGEMLGDTGFHEVLIKNSLLSAKDLGDFLTGLLHSFCGDKENFEDDITFSIIEID